MRIESRKGEMTLSLDRGERYEESVAGQNRVHMILDAAGRTIYTYVDVGAAAAGSRPRVSVRRSRAVDRERRRLPLLDLGDRFVACAFPGAWRRGVRLAP
jgi:hypothetical protein